MLPPELEHFLSLSPDTAILRFPPHSQMTTVNSKNCYVGWLMPSIFHWRKCKTSCTNCLRCYCLGTSQSGPTNQLCHSSTSPDCLAHSSYLHTYPKRQRKGSMCLQWGLSFSSFTPAPHPILSSFRQQWSGPISNTHVPPQWIKRANTWTLGVTRFSSLPVLHFKLPGSICKSQLPYR